MKKLIFKLFNNNHEVINEIVNYYESNNIIKFKIKDELYEYDKDNTILIKKDEEKEIIMNFQEKLIIINLLSNNIKIDYPMNECSIKIDKNNTILKYTLESEETVENTIFIEF